MGINPLAGNVGSLAALKVRDESPLPFSPECKRDCGVTPREEMTRLRQVGEHLLSVVVRLMGINNMQHIDKYSENLNKISD